MVTAQSGLRGREDPVSRDVPDGILEQEEDIRSKQRKSG